MNRHPESHHIALYAISLFCDKKPKPTDDCTFAHWFESRSLRVGERVRYTGAMSIARAWQRVAQSKERQNCNQLGGTNVSFVVALSLQQSMGRAKPCYAFSLSPPQNLRSLFTQTTTPLRCHPPSLSRLTTPSDSSCETFCRSVCPRLHLETFCCL